MTTPNKNNPLWSVLVGNGRPAFTDVLLAVAAMALLATSSDAQQQPTSPDEGSAVFGQILDSETGSPLIGAWVGLTGTEWGSISNPDGRFRIPDHEDGRLDLTIEVLGYQTLNWSGEVALGDAVQIEMVPEPILLEGIQVMADRFQSRRNAAGTSVLAFDASDLTRSTTMNARDFIAAQSGVFFTVCTGSRSSSCIWSRGRRVEPVVYVDEFLHMGGLDYLASFAPGEFHMVEVYNRGTHIRVYTPAFMKRVGEHRIVPLPLTGLRRR
jgi:hypothetical protein